VLNQVFEQGIGQPILVSPLGIAEDAVEGVGVGLLDFAHGALQGIADVGGDDTHIVPVAVVRDLEPVRFGEQGQFGITRVGDNLFVFFVPDIADALEEQ